MPEHPPAPLSPQVGAGGTVALVVNRRIAAADDEAYAQWQRRLGEVVERQPGFIRREIIPPNPPVQDDWVVVQHFRDVASARAWLQSDARRELLAQISPIFIGNDEVHLVTEENRHPAQAASALISTRVAPEQESEFLAWQREICATEARFDGFLGHKVERPIRGVQEDWVVILSFDTEQHLDAWLGSPQRRALLERGGAFGSDIRLAKASYGFGFWSGNPQPDPVFKSNLLVLLMLYPIVFLWGYFISEPLFERQGIPFWLSLFIGNLVSTQLLGWFVVPWAFRRFRWWLHPGRGWRTQLLGYGILIVLYAVSMAVYAWLLALR